MEQHRKRRWKQARRLRKRIREANVTKLHHQLSKIVKVPKRIEKPTKMGERTFHKRKQVLNPRRFESLQPNKTHQFLKRKNKK